MNREGGLEILSEVVMVALPRGDKEELRVTFTRAKTTEGRETAWHGIRVWYRADDGEMRPGKQGVTIRGKELAAVARELAKAASGGAAAAKPATSEPDEIPF
jgi:hypothetical protein